MVAELRKAGLRAELYLGEGGMKAQLKYADKRAAPIVVIEGSDERAKGEVTLKNMAKLADDIEDRDEYRNLVRTAQMTVRRDDLVARVTEMLDKLRSFG
jgi:histidyl-tRNA synthetase